MQNSRHIFSQIDANQPKLAGILSSYTDKSCSIVSIQFVQQTQQTLWTVNHFWNHLKMEAISSVGPGGGIFEEHWSEALSVAGRGIHFLCITGLCACNICPVFSLKFPLVAHKWSKAKKETQLRWIGKIPVSKWDMDWTGSLFNAQSDCMYHGICCLV